MKKTVIKDFVWFNTNNYEVLRNFKVEDWASVLHGRLVINDAVRSGKFDNRFKVPLYDEIIGGNISAPEKEPVKARKRLVTDTNDHVAFWDESHVVQHVMPFSIEGARLASEDIEGLVLDGVATEWSGESSYSDEYGLDIPYFEGVYPLDFVIDQQGFPFATVSLDLSATDDVIISELKNFLPKYREALGLKKSSSVADKDIAKLRTYRVIEYLDIQIWLAVNEREITDSLLSSVLFPGRDDHQSFFAQTVKPFILRVATREFVDSLLSRSRCAYRK